MCIINSYILFFCWDWERIRENTWNTFILFTSPFGSQYSVDSCHFGPLRHLSVICFRFVTLFFFIFFSPERWEKGLVKNSSCQRCFVLKVAPNHGNRYSELAKAIPCNILSFMYKCKPWNAKWYFIVLAAIYIIGHCRVLLLFDSNFFLFFPGPPACQKKRTYPKRNQAIPLLKRFSHGSTLSPTGFLQVFVYTVMSTASRTTEEPTIWTSNHRQLQFNMFLT